MQKLHRTCKYFCIQAPYLIVDTIVNDRDQCRIENEEYNDCIFYRHDSPIKNIWVTKKIDQCGWGGILWIIEKCTATELYLKDLGLMFDSFEILGKWNTVKRLVLDTVESKTSKLKRNYASSSYIYATHEEMIACFPSAEHIKVKCSMKCSPRSTPLFTMNQLLSIPYENKIKSFFLEDVEKIVNEDAYLKFLKAHAAENAKFGIVFRSENPQIEYENPQIANLKRKFDILYKDDIESRRITPQFKASVFVNVNREFNVVEFNKAKKFCFSSTNVQPQYFPKLQKTCKYFFFKHPYLIVTDIWSDCNCTRVTIDGKKYWTYDEIDYFPQILVTQALRFGVDDNKYFRKWMQKILRWDIPEVEFADFRLPYSSFKIVTKSQKVVKWNSKLCMVVEDKMKNHISIDSMLLHLPNIVDFT
uniref:Uncharacterized protein n=1 Tax=Panagrolaimus sp. ES5 TaxID=591445 RepID=A0AC34G123_9BILA